ncbi:MAG: hypothetical protein M1814_004440 [Vezdaea aestivalis]|nr:MAG: hypothetical protein M1814_004440 [Vezdaea aestivalis]
MDSLATAIETLRLDPSAPDDSTIDTFLDQRLPRKRPRPSPASIKADLEKTFLTPTPTFSSEWLNALQQRLPYTPNLETLQTLAPTQSRTTTRFTRTGLAGHITGYKEVTIPASRATAKTSTSMLRKPANRADFVRGAAGFFPFAPGGLEEVEKLAEAEEVESEMRREGRSGGLERVIEFGTTGGLLIVPPGFERGGRFLERGAGREEEAVKTAMGEDAVEAVGGEGGGENGEEEEKEDVAEAEDEEEDIDALLPIEFAAFEPHGALKPSSAKRHGREWAHMVDIKQGMPNFYELVPNMAKEWPFELDTFQKEAVYHLESGDSVFVAAHTSAGKTVVAEYAIALAAKHMTKAIYTSPIKALSNQKFRDFRQEFGDVGILTGDVQIRPEASCLIMTTEILRSMLYRGADLIRDVEFVIFDEVHYVNDLERGVVWEEVIIMLPDHVTFILLSATVPNTYEFASWVGRTKKKDIYVISTPKRPVPLEHFLWAGKGMHKIVDAEKRFQEKGWKEANDILSGRDKVKAAMPGGQASSHRGDRGGAQRGRGQRGGQQQRGRGQPNRGAPQRGGSSGTVSRGGRGGMRSAAQDRNIWVHLVQHLRKEDLLPACIFVFSKKRCEENADALSNLDYCTGTEKSAIHMTLEKSLARLRPEDRVLPQIRRLRDLLARGIAVHHGGLLPVVKECVEILFAKTLVKVLFATETFAMGLNLPTRTVVFSGFRKHDGRSFRNLLAGEYTQMAGRAGRRGIDTVGSVIIVSSAEEAPPVAALREMILGDPTKLRSQFRLTYNMILNLLRVEALKIEEMIKRSFSESATQALLPEHEKQVKISEADLAKIKREPCEICDVDLEACHQASMNYKRLTSDLHLGLASSPVGRRMFAAKRLIVYNRDYIRRAGIIFKEISNGPDPTVGVMEIVLPADKRDFSFLLPTLPKFRRFFSSLAADELRFKAVTVPLGDIETVTTVIKAKGPLWRLGQKETKINESQENISKVSQSWESSDWDEIDWEKIRDLQLREILEERRKEAKIAESARCLTCPNFLKHFAMQHDEWLIKENISQLNLLLSDQNLQLLPDYEQRICVLKDMGFIDEGSRVELKGKVACEIHSADELVLTELVLENVLADYEPEEIVALLSAFVFQEKTDNVPTLTPKLERGRDKIIEISEKVNALQIQYQVILSSDDSNDFVSRPRFGLVEVVYEWARGMSFNRITDLTDVLEGTIVRVISRLDETCREVKNAARIIGDPSLFTKMQTCQELIRRDITAVASL